MHGCLWMCRYYTMHTIINRTPQEKMSFVSLISSEKKIIFLKQKQYFKYFLTIARKKPCYSLEKKNIKIMKDFLCELFIRNFKDTSYTEICWEFLQVTCHLTVTLCDWILHVTLKTLHTLRSVLNFYKLLITWLTEYEWILHVT